MMEVGQYTNAAGQVFHGDIPRYMAGDPSAGMLSGGFLFKMFGLLLQPLLFGIQQNLRIVLKLAVL
jgi:hypothetical protein